MSVLTPDETILGLLAMQSRHGYELLDCFRNSSQLGDVWKLSTSQIYAVLKRLERQCWIVGQETPQENAPPRTEFMLTPDGEERLFEWLDEPYPSASIRRVRVEFLSRLYIARGLNIPTIAIVKRQKRACQDELNTLIEQRQQISLGVSFLAHELAIAQLQAVISWIDRCELVPKDIGDEW